MTMLAVRAHILTDATLTFMKITSQMQRLLYVIKRWIDEAF